VTTTWALAALWVGLALAATLLSIWLRIATALSEIVVAAQHGAQLQDLLPRCPSFHPQSLHCCTAHPQECDALLHELSTDHRETTGAPHR
jgi:hypothetical protein